MRVGGDGSALVPHLAIDRVGSVLVTSWIHTVVSPPTELLAIALVGDHGARIEHTPPARSCASAVCHWHRHPD